MVRTALSLGIEGMKELRRFVYNARRDGTRGSESLVTSDFDLIAPILISPIDTTVTRWSRKTMASLKFVQRTDVVGSLQCH